MIFPWYLENVSVAIRFPYLPPSGRFAGRSFHFRGFPPWSTCSRAVLNPTSQARASHRVAPVESETPNPFDFPSRGRYSYAQIDEEVLQLREYEIVYVIRTDLSEEDRSAKIERIHSLITENGGELGKVEDWGKRVLAYEIKHNTEGYYGLAEFYLPPDSVRTVEDRLNIDEEILRYQIISRS